MKRLESCVPPKRIKYSESDDAVKLILDDDNVHLGNLLRNRMNKTTTITQYTFHLENETTIHNMEHEHLFRYHPHLNALAYLHNHTTIQMLNLTTQTTSTLIEISHRLDLNDESNVCICDFEIVERDYSIIYLKRCGKAKYSRAFVYSVVKVDLKLGELIWEFTLPGNSDGCAYVTYYQQLNMLFIGIDDQIYRMDGISGEIWNPIEFSVFRGNVFIDSVGKVYITSHIKDCHPNLASACVLREDMSVEREIQFQLLDDSDPYFTIANVIDDRFIITHFGEIYDWNNGRYLGHLGGGGMFVERGSIIMKGDRVFKHFYGHHDTIVSYHFSIGKEMIECPLGKLECEKIQTLGGTIPKYHLRDGIISSFFLHTTWNGQNMFDWL